MLTHSLPHASRRHRAWSHLFRLSALACLSVTPLRGQEVTSPDGNLQVKLNLKAGELTYQVALRNKTFIEPSPLGLETSLGNFSKGLKAAGTSSTLIDEHYALPHGKVSQVHYQANELTARFETEQGDTMEVIFRVSNRDVAFAYRLSGPEKGRIVITGERTGFDLPSEATAFVTPQVAWGGGYKATKPSYEEAYKTDVPVGTQSGTGLGFTFPALFRVGDAGWVLLSETGVSSLYVGSRLGDPTPEGLYPLAFPESAENAGVGDATVSAPLPLLTPWRTLTIGDSLAPIVETTVATDVVKPLYEASEAYRPGRATWSWLLWQDPSMNEPDQRAFIDLAADLGYEYILIDALWDVNIGRSKMAELVAYAKSKKVDVLLWYNSNGSWNDAPQTPKNCLDTAPARQKEMAWMKSIGVKGMKVDFFGGDKQATMKLYEDILTDANTYGLVLNFHGATLPRGWERMYPNHMTSEAVTASENLVFSQGFADEEARQSTIYPFVRNPVAAMDFGPLVLNKRFSKSHDQGNVRRTTDSFQLATAVLFQSPLQHFGLVPNNLKEQPAHVIDFLKTVPTVWDETRYLAGYPGRHVAIARRHGQTWYLAATQAESSATPLVLSVPFLKGQTVKSLSTGADGVTQAGTLTIGADGLLSLNLKAGDGLVAIHTQEKPAEVSQDRARAQFARPIELAADDVRLFPEPPTDFKSVKAGVPQGQVEAFEYDSGVTGKRRKANVYLPPGYNKSTRYPVVYLLHGIGGDENEWMHFASPNRILDNLIAEGKAVPMIIVMPNGRAIPDDRAEGNPFTPEKAEGFAKFERDLLDFLIPAIQAKYATHTAREQRALVGLSMGGGQAFNFGLTHLDTFAWVGAFSAAPNTRPPAELIPNPAALTEKLKLLYISCGNKDGLINFSQGMHRYLKQHEVPHLWNVDDHGHDAETWGSNLYHLAQRLFR